MKKLLVAIIVFLGALASRDASALVTAEGRYWFTDLSSTAQISGSGIPGTDINLVKDTGLESSKGFPEVRLGFNIGSHRIRYAFVPLSWSGSGSLTQTFNFAGQTFSATDRVNSDLRAYYHRLGYEWDIIDVLGNRLGPVIEIKYFDIDAHIKDTTTGMEESKRINLPVPAIGVAGRIALPFLFGVGGELTGMSLGSMAYVVDAEASADFKPVPFVSVEAGYRVLALHVDYSNSKANMTVKGPFVGLKAEF